MNLLDKLEAINRWNNAAEIFRNVVDYKGSKIGYLQCKPIIEQSNFLDDCLFGDDPTISEHLDGLRSNHFSPPTPPNSSEVLMNNINTNSETSLEQHDRPVSENIEGSTFIQLESNDSNAISLVNTDDSQTYAQNHPHEKEIDSNCREQQLLEAPDVHQNQSTHIQSDSTRRDPENLIGSLNQLVSDPFNGDAYRMHSSDIETNDVYNEKLSNSNDLSGENLPLSPDLNRECTDDMNGGYDDGIFRDTLCQSRRVSDISSEMGHSQFNQTPKQSCEFRYFEFDFDSLFESDDVSNIIGSCGTEEVISGHRVGNIGAHVDPPSEMIDFQKDHCLLLLSDTTSNSVGHTQSGCERAQQDAECQQQAASNMSSELYSSSSLSSSANSVSCQSDIDEEKSKTCVNKLFTCEICGKTNFSTKGNLTRHMRSHTGEKKYHCDHCDAKFTEKKSLKIHARKHTGERPYKCEICDKEFTQAVVLKDHVALHLNERRFPCSECDKAFRQRTQLKIHMMRHNGIKNYECSNCESRFSTKGDLNRHFRTHTGEKPFSCQFCGKTFTRARGLNEHLPSHLGRKSKTFT